MKKFYTVLAAIGAVASLAAQQLPNAGFEDDWADFQPYTGGSSKNVGTTPTPWTIANVAGYKFGIVWIGSTEVGSKVDGCNSASAVELKNKKTAGKGIPGYITLGTSWNTANTSGNNKDGGSFGGTEFSYRPDAMQIDYKRTLNEGSTEKATVVAYTWVGTATQTNVPVNIASSPTKAPMIDRDRNVLGMEYTYGDTPTFSDDFKLVSKLEYSITEAQTEWAPITIPFEYFVKESPAKINVIFSASDYFYSTEPEEGNALTVDNVKMLYYSRLSGLKFKDADIADFDPDTFDYELDEIMPTDESDLTATTMGNSGVAQAAVELDQQKNIAKITVTNDHGNDVDDQNSHVYTVKFLPAGSSINDVNDMTAENVRYVDLYGNAVAADALVPGQTYIKLVNGKASKIAL